MSDVISVPTPAGHLPVHRWLPPSGTGPGILLLQEIFGVSDYVRDRAADLAAAGYVVHAPELYWRLGDATLDEGSPDVLDRAMALVQELPWDDALADARAALDQLRRSSWTTGRVGIVGFCYGGGLAFNVSALDPPEVLVSYYGSALPGLLDLAPQVRVPSLHHFGTEDTFIPMDVVAQVRDAVQGVGPQVEFELYDGAGHAFDNPSPMFHHPEASAAAWPRTLRFLAKHLGPAAG